MSAAVASIIGSILSLIGVMIIGLFQFVTRSDQTKQNIEIEKAKKQALAEARESALLEALLTSNKAINDAVESQSRVLQKLEMHMSNDADNFVGISNNLNEITKNIDIMAATISELANFEIKQIGRPDTGRKK